MNARRIIARAIARGLIDDDDAAWMCAGPRRDETAWLELRSINVDLGARLARRMLQRDLVLPYIDVLRVAADVRALEWNGDRIALRALFGEPESLYFAVASPGYPAAWAKLCELRS